VEECFFILRFYFNIIYEEKNLIIQILKFHDFLTHIIEKTKLIMSELSKLKPLIAVNKVKIKINFDHLIPSQIVLWIKADC
jgi:hypothetical protein